MELETPRLRLRPLLVTDTSAHYAVVDSDPAVTWLGVARTPDEGRRYVAAKAGLWARHGFGPCAVVEKATGAFLGHGGLEPLDETGEVQLSYYLGRPAWGQGYATELSRAALDFGFQSLNIERIVAIVRPPNAASRRVLLKLGFEHERDGHFSGADAQYWSLARASAQASDSPFPPSPQGAIP